MANSKALVWIVWNSNKAAKTGSESTINVLTFGGGENRVYEKDRYDSRLISGSLPYFKTLGELGAFFVANPGEPCQVDVRTALFDD